MENKEFILDYFVNGRDSRAKQIKGMPEDCKAYCFRRNGELGVMIPFESNEIINESFSGSKLYSRSFSLGDNSIEEGYLLLSSDLVDNEHNEAFAAICLDFVDPANRDNLITDPLKWWKAWKEIIGNGELNKTPYDLIAEMIALDYMAKKGMDPKWEGPQGGTVDIRSDVYDCEVKSSTNRYDDLIEISSQYQIDNKERPLHLYYLVFQKSDAGLSIDDMISRLIISGFRQDFLESLVKKRGYLPGNSARREKYQLIKMWDFPVDSSFPVINDTSFKDGVRPKGVKKISYTVDLSLLNYSVLDYK